MLYATFGRGREAVRTLERYLEAKSDDTSAHCYAVQCFYPVHSQGVVVHNRAQDVQLAKSHAAVYEKGRRPAVAAGQAVDQLPRERKVARVLFSRRSTDAKHQEFLERHDKCVAKIAVRHLTSRNSMRQNVRLMIFEPFNVRFCPFPAVESLDPIAHGRSRSRLSHPPK